MKKKNFWTGVFAGAAALGLAACLMPVGDGDGLDKSGNPIPAVLPDTNLTFVVNNVFEAKCTGCHGNLPSGAGNALTLVTVAGARSTLFPNGEMRLTVAEPDVSPRWRVYASQEDSTGDIDSSYLYQKIASSTPKDGVQMPQGGANGGYLTADELMIVRRWIEKGAQLE